MRFTSVTAVVDPAPGRAPTLADELAAAAGVPCTRIEAHGDGAGRRVAEQVNAADGTLVVIDTYRSGVGGDLLTDAGAEAVLRHVVQPILVVGDADRRELPQNLVLPLDGASLAGEAIPIVDRWVHSFGGGHVVVLVLEAPDPWPIGSRAASAAVRDGEDVAARLRARGVSAAVRRAETLEAWQTIVEAAEHEPGNAMIVLPTPRWSSTTHWYATSRRLIRRSSSPVLVVPTDALDPSPAT